MVFVMFGTKMAKKGNGKEPKKGVFFTLRLNNTPRFEMTAGIIKRVV